MSNPGSRNQRRSTNSSSRDEEALESDSVSNLPSIPTLKFSSHFAENNLREFSEKLMAFTMIKYSYLVYVLENNAAYVPEEVPLPLATIIETEDVFSNSNDPGGRFKSLYNTQISQRLSLISQLERDSLALFAIIYSKLSPHPSLHGAT